MSRAPTIIAIGCVDAEGIAGSRGLRTSWEQLGAQAPGNGRTYRALSGKADQTFRRLDGQTRALVLAAEACALGEFLSAEERAETALVIETSLGCLEVDLRYSRALDAGIVHSAIFPYTLQSTCLGDVALRHGLRGPTLSLSIEPGQEGEALREARRLLESGSVRHVLAGTVDVFAETLSSAGPALRAVTCLIAAPGESTRAVCAWPQHAAGDPFAALSEACWSPAS